MKQFTETEMQNCTQSAGQLDWSFMEYTTPEVDPLNKIKSTDNVYSFGVILLEIITGKPAFDVNRPKNERNLVEWIKSSVSGDETKLAQIMDLNLKGTSGCRNSAMRVLTLSSKCTEEDPKKRPSMSQVLKELAPIVEESKKNHNESVAMERQADDLVLCTGVAEAIGHLLTGLVHAL